MKRVVILLLVLTVALVSGVYGSTAKNNANNASERVGTQDKVKWSSRSKKVMSWKQANQYCENLKEGGTSDWRLPTISELRTLVMNCESTETGGSCGVTDQCLSAEQCKNKACKGCGKKFRHNKFGDKGFFWSSSISSKNKNAWYIDFTYGSVHNHSNSEKFVRCVSPDTTSGRDMTRKDASAKTFSSKASKKGHIWSGVSKKVMDWNTANQYCENLKEGGASDWRLPTISELRTLITNCKSTETSGTCRVTDQCLSSEQCKNKACNGCGRKGRHNKFGDKGFFWSSSISSKNKNAWYIDFTYGSIQNHSKNKKSVRCVR